MAIYAKCGDTFFTRSNTLLGKLIRWGEKECKETEAAWTNHSGVVVQDGELGGRNDAVVIEALWHTRRGNFDQKSEIRVFRPVPAYTPEERLRFCTEANEYVGDKYGWWKLIGFLIKRLTNCAVNLPEAYFIDSRPICSYLAAKVNHAARALPGFGMDPQAADPDSMMDFCLTHPEFWQEVK